MKVFPHVIEFEHVTTQSDGGGGYTEDWETFKESEAYVQPFRSTEYFRMNVSGPEIKSYYKIFVPYQSDIHERMRVVYDGGIYNIQQITDQGGYQKIQQLICTFFE